MAQLYAIVSNLARAQWLLEAQVPYVQLRFKAQPLAPHAEQLREWVAQYPASRLVINDDLDLALTVGAWGVHLGQDDLTRYEGNTLRQAPLSLGISTHTPQEIAHALTFAPAIIGFGPVFATASKSLTYPPQGLQRLQQVVAQVPVPVVAIGGIGPHNMRQVVASGAGLLAMLSHLDTLTTVSQLQQLMDRLKP